MGLTGLPPKRPPSELLAAFGRGLSRESRVAQVGGHTAEGDRGWASDFCFGI